MRLQKKYFLKFVGRATDFCMSVRARVKCLHLLRRWEPKPALLREPRPQYHSTKETRQGTFFYTLYDEGGGRVPRVASRHDDDDAPAPSGRALLGLVRGVGDRQELTAPLLLKEENSN